MQFSSLNEFIAMGGHGFYVWISYGFSFVCMALLVYLSCNKQKQVKRNILKKLRRDAKLQQAQERYEKKKIEDEKDLEV